MKQFGLFCMIFALLICVSGCFHKNSETEGVAFYYCNEETAYQVGQAAIVSEDRSDAVQAPLEEALEMYLSGPRSSSLRSPFPKGLVLVECRQENGRVYLTLSRELALLTGLDLTMACSCLTLTVLELTGAETVEICAHSCLLDGQERIIMDKNTLLLVDTAAAEE